MLFRFRLACGPFFPIMNLNRTNLLCCLALLLAAASCVAAAPPAADVVAAPTAPVKPPVLSGTLTLEKVEKHETSKVEEPKPLWLHLGDVLIVRATEGMAEALLVQLTAPAQSRRLALYLGGVEMKEQPWHYAVPQESAAGKKLPEVSMRFTLDRNSESVANRQAWDEVLEHLAWDQQLEVAVAAGNNAPWVVGSIRFELAPSTTRKYALWGALVVFVLLFAGTSWFSNMLKDSGAADAPYSLGRVQMAFWGLLVLVCWCGVVAVTGTLEALPTEVLVLLGISATTGLGAIVIQNQQEAEQREREAWEGEKARLENQRNNLVAPAALPQADADRLAELVRLLSGRPKASAALTDAGHLKNFLRDICHDGQGLSFHRLQVVLWTMVLGGVFVMKVASVLSMPVFSSTLLVLMGISNGTYLGFKIPER